MAWWEGSDETRLLIAADTAETGNDAGQLLSLRHPKSDESSSEHPASSLLGTPNIGSSFGVMKTGFPENYATKFKSRPPPPKSATPPHHAPTPPKHIPTVTDLFDKSPPSTPYIYSA